MLLSRTNLKQNYTEKLKINIKKIRRAKVYQENTKRAKIVKLISDYIESKVFNRTDRFISY